MYFGNYDSNGKYIGFYASEIHGDNIPLPFVELNNSEWQEALSGDYCVIDEKHTYIEPTLATQEELLQQNLLVLDCEYKPQFLELSQALIMATLSDNVDLMANIKNEYYCLKSEYDVKRGELIG